MSEAPVLVRLVSGACEADASPQADPSGTGMAPEPCGGVPPAKNAPLTVCFDEGQTLAQAVYLSGLFPPPPLCSGLSRCGRCRVRLPADPRAPAPSGAFVPPEPVPADRLVFSPEELALGWRLACRHAPRHGLLVELPEGIRASSSGVLSEPDSSEAAGTEPGTSPGLLLAVDLGTTSLQWRLLAVESGAESPGSAATRILWQGSRVNPQMGAGSDVISRLAVAQSPHGAATLRRLTLDALRELVRRSSAPSGARGTRGVAALCLAGNPAMTAISLGLDIAGLARAPYSLPCSGGTWEQASGLPPLWIPPQLSPFVGGDISAGYAALALDPAAPAPVFPFLLADMGTNGEFLLALSPDKALCASVALGPALEGIGLACGVEARALAVVDFTLGPQGLTAWMLPEDGGAPLPATRGQQPSGITGTGYLALLHLLLQSGAMDRQGRFTPEASGPLRRFFVLERDPLRGEAFLLLPHGLRLYASDVEEALKVKAAFSLGLRRLLDASGLASRELARVFLAGALGGHVNRRALENLGFFPPGMDSRITAAGNTSLAGAALLAGNEAVRAALTAWAEGVAGLDLAADPAFAAAYAEHMRFAW